MFTVCTELHCGTSESQFQWTGKEDSNTGRWTTLLAWNALKMSLDILSLHLSWETACSYASSLPWYSIKISNDTILLSTWQGNKVRGQSHSTSLWISRWAIGRQLCPSMTVADTLTLCGKRWSEFRPHSPISTQMKTCYPGRDTTSCLLLQIQIT